MLAFLLVYGAGAVAIVSFDATKYDSHLTVRLSLGLKALVQRQPQWLPYRPDD